MLPKEIFSKLLGEFRVFGGERKFLCVCACDLPSSKINECIDLTEHRKFFDFYEITLGQDESHLQKNISEESWLFLNHLSSIICIDAIKPSIGEAKSISYKDLTQTLIKIQSTKIGGKWEVPVIKKSASTLFEKLDFDAIDYSVSSLSDDNLVLD